MREAERKRDGVEIEDATWAKLSDLAEAAGLSAQLGFA
jgi:LDH2 family malate/lactate/ureidoglycolate dehydrogenase